MKTDVFQSYGHGWVFQIRWRIECSTFTASSLRIWNSWTGILSPPLALFIVMLPKAHLTSHCRMSGSQWVITPSWWSGSWRSVLCSPSVYSCHLFFTYCNVHMSTLISQFIPAPTMSTHLFSTFASLFLPWEQVHLYHFSRFYIYVLTFDQTVFPAPNFFGHCSVAEHCQQQHVCSRFPWRCSIANYYIAFPMIFLFVSSHISSLINSERSQDSRAEKSEEIVSLSFYSAQPGSRTMTVLEGTTVPAKGNLNDSDSWWKCEAVRTCKAEMSRRVWGSSMTETRLVWFGNIPTYTALWVNKTSDNAIVQT